MVSLTEFEKNGCALVKNFATKEECEQMKSRMEDIVDQWNGKCECLFTTEKTGQSKTQGQSEYFMSSGNQIRFFLESDAVDDSNGIKPGLNKLRAINKVGHGLHIKDDVFGKYTFSEKVCNLVKDLGWSNAVIPQSMYIMKNSKVGSEVTSHQDSTFLYTEPKPTCLGLWLALDDATLTNGCLWYRKGSHKEPVRKLWKKNDEGNMIFEDLVSKEEMDSLPLEGSSLEGLTHDDVRKKGFEPVECEAGDLVLIHGQVDHLSLANKSEKPRHTFQLHLVEGPKAGIHWSKHNWNQYPEGEEFRELVPQQ
mmetsp:Transcript_16690/g.18897  ORF Transcript_16690/g.18897 Transcript_16690/m.18897 type:complete len:308 (+) Transcript_16690:179-1102(+)